MNIPAINMYNYLRIKWFENVTKKVWRQYVKEMSLYCDTQAQVMVDYTTFQWHAMTNLLNKNLVVTYSYC